MTINLNDRVRVRLTAYGKRIARNQFSRSEYCAPGTLCVQLWRLMQVFGPMLRIGMHHVPFANNEITVEER